MKRPLACVKMKNLMRRVGPALVAPDADEEVHRHQHQLPEEVEEEQVEREEHAEHAHQAPHQVEVEEADPLGDLGPRGEHRDDAEEQREQHHEQAHAVDGEVDADAELRDPRPVELRDPAAAAAAAAPPAPAPDRSPASPGRSSAARRAARADGPGEEAADEREQDDRREDHANSTRATMIAVPPARPIAYQRSVAVLAARKGAVEPARRERDPAEGSIEHVALGRRAASQRYGRTRRRS